MLAQTFLYLMLKPCAATQLELNRLRRAFSIPETYAAERLHISLLPLGPEIAWSQALLHRLDQTLSAFWAAPVPIKFDRLDGATLRGTTGARALRGFHRELIRHLERAGFGVPAYQFNPHMTLAYGEDRPRARAMIEPIGWTAQETLLIRSGHGRHEVMNCWPLVSAQFDLFA